MSINWINLGIGAVAGYLIMSLISSKGYATHKDSTNPWDISNIQRSMMSPPDKIVHRPGEYTPHGGHAPLPYEPPPGFP